MRSIRRVFCLGIVLLISGRGICRAQINPAPVVPVLDARARAADPRLEVPLTFDADRMYLGEILEKVSAQTGVSVSIPPKELESGIQITCHLKEVPLADFMNSVWSLVGFAGATWQITSDGRQTNPRYQLLTTQEAHSLAERLRLETDKATAKLWHLLLKISLLTPKERQSYIPQLAEAMLVEEAVAKSYLRDDPSSNQRWFKISLFATDLSAAQQDQALRGVPVSVSLSSLTSAHQEQLRALEGQHYVEVDGLQKENVPDRLQFTFANSITNKKSLVRNLFIGVGNETSMVSRSVMGGLNVGVKSWIQENWILPGDGKSTAAEAQTVAAWPEYPVESLWQHVSGFDRQLTQLADAQGVSYLGVVPEDASASDMLSTGKSAKFYLDGLRSERDLMHKWRSGVLLFSYPQWFYGDEAQYPYSVVKQLRDSRRRHVDGEPLTVAEIADAVVTLNDAQMKRLAKEFPQVESNKHKRPLFAFYKKHPGLLAKEGILVDLNMLAMMQEAKLIPRLSQNESVERVRIAELLSDTPDRREYALQVQRNHEEMWEGMGSFAIKADRKL